MINSCQDKGRGRCPSLLLAQRLYNVPAAFSTPYGVKNWSASPSNLGEKSAVGGAQFRNMIQTPALNYFTSIETCVVELLTPNLALSHFGGPKVTLTLFENPYGSRGMPKTFLSILPLLFSS
jgi:hypothetical protein